MSTKGAIRPIVERTVGSAVESEPHGWVGTDPHVVSVPEAARLLGISKDLAYNLARRGELPGAFQLGRRWRVSLVRLRAAVHGAEDRAPGDGG
jgi:excisionase family DNA binding protein